MSATGDEVVTLKQLNMAMDSAGGGTPLKTITVSDNADDLRNFDDVGIYYRSGGGSIPGIPTGLKSAPMVLEVLPMWYTGEYWVMMQRCTGVSCNTYVRAIGSGNVWGAWKQLTPN